MAATQNLAQVLEPRNSIELLTPRRGVVTLFGYGIKVRVDRGHLTLEDGVGPHRREARLPRVRHGLRRLIVIGADGMVSFAALRWLADQDATFVMLDRDGSVLATTGPVRPSDARLRRAQALAHESGAALQISRELISQKLEAQEKLARGALKNSAAADAITRIRETLPAAKTIERIRLLESRGAYAYWSAWSDLPINFPKSDLRRVPDHWRSFKNRVSPLTGSPRLAANPVNAMLNYFYALLESETRLAVAALGLDPGLGVLHMDAPARDSLAFDVMEPARPMVDEYVLNWITSGTLKREWFFEQRDGSCRLMGPFAVQLAQTSPTWASAVAPLAEMVSRILWSGIRKQIRHHRPPTRLTQLHRREAKGISIEPTPTSPPRVESYCRECGAKIGRGRDHCATCALKLSTTALIEAAARGRVAAQGDEAQARRSKTQLRHRAAFLAWKSSDLPSWLDEKCYLTEIQPRLRRITLSVLSSKLDISIPYAVDIRSAKRVPHKRHWSTLAELVGVFPSARNLGRTIISE
jgi:CRISPR-associated endonuclease Cas1